MLDDNDYVVNNNNNNNNNNNRLLKFRVNGQVANDRNSTRYIKQATINRRQRKQTQAK